MKTLLERDDEERKNTPILDGVLAFFPNALTACSDNSMAGQLQHNKGKPFFWDRTKSQDELGSLTRHILDFILAEQAGNYEEMAKASKAIVWRGNAHAERFFGTTPEDPKRYQDAKALRDGTTQEEEGDSKEGPLSGTVTNGRESCNACFYATSESCEDKGFLCPYVFDVGRHFLRAPTSEEIEGFTRNAT